MEKFEFLIGSWNLEYNIPKSSFSEIKTGTGFGTFKRTLDDKYVFFDYKSNIEGETGVAHGIFAWEKKAQIYRYWWFESSGAYMEATCNFTDDDTLFINWHNSLLIQTFKKIDHKNVQLHMSNVISEDKNELILEVILIRK
jgi:hypothetical protein